MGVSVEVGRKRSSEVGRNLQNGPQAPPFQRSPPGTCSSHLCHSVAPSLHAGILSQWRRQSGQPGRSGASHTPHCEEPAGPLRLGTAGRDSCGQKTAGLWKSSPAAQTHVESRCGSC